jgi:hypothetical protein
VGTDYFLRATARLLARNRAMLAGLAVPFLVSLARSNRDNELGDRFLFPLGQMMSAGKRVSADGSSDGASTIRNGFAGIPQLKPF